MNARDCAVLAFKLFGLWFASNGVMGAANIPFFWQSDHEEIVRAAMLLGAALPLLVSLMVGALLWVNAERLATHVFGDDPALMAARVFGEEGDAAPPARQDRSDVQALFALALAVIGVLLVTEAVPGLASSLALYLYSRRAGSAVLGPDPAQGARIWDTAARASLAGSITRLAIGLTLLAGPARLSAAYARVRREFKGTLGDEPASALAAPSADEPPAAPPSDRVAP